MSPIAAGQKNSPEQKNRSHKMLISLFWRFNPIAWKKCKPIHTKKLDNMKEMSLQKTRWYERNVKWRTFLSPPTQRRSSYCRFWNCGKVSHGSTYLAFDACVNDWMGRLWNLSTKGMVNISKSWEGKPIVMGFQFFGRSKQGIWTFTAATLWLAKKRVLNVYSLIVVSSICCS